MDLKIYDALNILPTSFIANGNMVRAIGGPTLRLITSRCVHIERKFGLNPVYEIVMINESAVAIDILIIRPRTILGLSFFILAITLLIPIC